LEVTYVAGAFHEKQLRSSATVLIWNASGNADGQHANSSERLAVATLAV